MPSSSNRDTTHEQQLAQFFQLAYPRLLLSGNQISNSQIILRIYVELLDCPAKALLDAHLNINTRWWADMKASCAKHTPSENMWAAADAMSDMAVCLKDAGRMVEAGETWEVAGQLYDLAREENEYERMITAG